VGVQVQGGPLHGGERGFEQGTCTPCTPLPPWGGVRERERGVLPKRRLLTGGRWGGGVQGVQGVC
jgi:hypothetical protein